MNAIAHGDIAPNSPAVVLQGGIKTTKFCPGCRIEKPYSAFAKARTRYDGVQSRCRACAADRKHTIQHKSVEQKTCIACGLTKPAIAFYKNYGVVDGLAGRCKACYKRDRVLTEPDKLNEVARHRVAQTRINRKNRAAVMAKQNDRILELRKQGLTTFEICMHVFGNDKTANFTAIQRYIDTLPRRLRERYG